MEALAICTNIKTENRHPDRLAKWMPYAGYENSSAWCRNIQELINVITHGEQVAVMQGKTMILKDAISQSDALEIVSRLIEQKRAEEIPMQAGSVTWSIHHWGKDDPNFHFKAS